MTSAIESKIRINFITAILSFIFAIIGFSYNAWRMEVTEDNSNIRTASFKVLTELSKLEQTIYALHYDKNLTEGSPRRAWVSIGLIHDLSLLINQDVHTDAKSLKTLWQDKWPNVQESRPATDQLIESIDEVREEITLALSKLK